MEDYPRREDRLILAGVNPDQHGRHLPLSTDCLISTAIAVLLAGRTG